MQSSNQSTMESVKECHIQLHSSPNVLPYQVVDDGQGLKSPTTNLVDDLWSSDKFGEFLVASFACREKPRSVPRISEADSVGEPVGFSTLPPKGAEELLRSIEK